MDFRLTEEQEKFRQEITRFIKDNASAELIEEIESTSMLGPGPRQRDFVQRLGAKGWLTPHFPKEYGGLGLSYIYRTIVVDEMMRYLMKGHLSSAGFGFMFGTDMAGPAILRYGSEEMKEEFLPRIARGEIDFCIGYTEPEAGSDLSRVEMRAVEDGDYFVINGQKVFSSSAHYAQYHWLLVRTDPNVPGHRGVSMFVVDLKSPGITISPLWTIAGGRTNEVFYDEVRVHKRYLTGEKNRGWYYLMHSLDMERSLTVMGLQLFFEELLAYVKRTSRNGVPLSKDPLVRQKLAQMAVELRISQRFNQRVIWLQEQGMPAGTEASISKMFFSECMQRMVNLSMHILGLRGPLRKTSERAVLDKNCVSGFLESILWTIAGGTSEIMRNIIALRGLGLPRGRES